MSQDGWLHSIIIAILMLGRWFFGNSETWNLEIGRCCEEWKWDGRWTSWDGSREVFIVKGYVGGQVFPSIMVFS